MDTLVAVGSDPLHALWHATGRPRPALAFTDGPVTCARCADPVQTSVRAVDVVSDKFTGWDAYTSAGQTPRWCVPCAWGHTEPSLRQVPWLITPTYARQATPAMLAHTLNRPVPADVAVIVPVARKKHLLPSARWGSVTTDTRALPWGTTEADRFATLTRLREHGFSEAALAEPVPRFEHLRTLPVLLQVEVMGIWGDLDGWRTDPAYLAVACRATRKERR